MIEAIIDLYVKIAEVAVPVALVFEVGNLIVNTVIRTAFGGRLWFGRD